MLISIRMSSGQDALLHLSTVLRLVPGKEGLIKPEPR